MGQQKILITGCSSGIGAATAEVLRDKGWHVLACARKPQDIEALQRQGFEALHVDYADSQSLIAARDYILTHHDGRIDALFNNGAFALPSAVEDLPRAGLAHLFETNLFGVHELTTLIIPLMRAQGHGRILNCSSVLGFVGAPWRGAYVASKFALEGLTDTMRIEMNGTGISLILINPGPITSKIRENAIPHYEKYINWQASARKEEYAAKLNKRLYEAQGPERYELPAAAVGELVFKALTDRKPKARYLITKPTYVAWALKRLLPTRSLDRVLAKF